VLIGMGGLGIFVAGLTTAVLVTRLGRKRSVFLALVLAAIAQLTLACRWSADRAARRVPHRLRRPGGEAVRGRRRAARHRDEIRGRVFALYDMLFNITQAVAVAVAALVIPANGESVGLIVAATCVYCWGSPGSRWSPGGSGGVTPSASAHLRSSAIASSWSSGPRSRRSSFR